MKREVKKIIVSMVVIITFCMSVFSDTVYADKDEMVLYAKSACVMDASNYRVLYEKNADEFRAIASTTKIMSAIIALENGDLSKKVSVSKYAASMPDVQMDLCAGEEYLLKDMLYAMMLESFNDASVVLAEGVAGSTNAFAQMMNEKAESLGCANTYFITPNGLDGVDENGKNGSTARELATIASYAIKNTDFVEICNTRSYTVNECNGKRTRTAYNKDSFLDRMDGAIGIKTGFTCEAGYCFVGAVRNNGNTYVSVVLGAGWPPNKTYKWRDTIKLMDYAIDNYTVKQLFKGRVECDRVRVENGVQEYVKTYAEGDIAALISQNEKVTVYYNIRKCMNAPIEAGEIAGFAEIFIDDELFCTIPIITEKSVKKIGFSFCFKKIIREYTLFIKKC